MNVEQLKYNSIDIAKFVGNTFLNTYLVSQPIPYNNITVQFLVLCAFKEQSPLFTESDDLIEYIRETVCTQGTDCVNDLNKIGIIGYKSSKQGYIVWLNNAILHGVSDAPDTKMDFYKDVASSNNYQQYASRNLLYPKKNIIEALQTDETVYRDIIHKDNEYYRLLVDLLTNMNVQQESRSGSGSGSSRQMVPQIDGSPYGCVNYVKYTAAPEASPGSNPTDGINELINSINTSENGPVSLINPTGDGECLFCCLAYAFQDTNVSTIRNNYVDEIFNPSYASEEAAAAAANQPPWYTEYLQVYSDAINNGKNVPHYLKWMTAWPTVSGSSNAYQGYELASQAIEPLDPSNPAPYNSSELKETISIMMTKMKITALDIRRTLKLSSEFVWWGDELVIRNIPKLSLMLPIIINNNGDVLNLMLEPSETRGINQYIILYHQDGIHYMLIEINEKRTIQATEIPEALTRKLVSSNQVGTYNLAGGGKIDTKLLEGLNETVLMITDKKMEPTLPGLAENEKIDKLDIKKFMGLVKTPKWREKLHHNHKCKFELDGKYWSSPVHFQMAQLFKERYPLYYNNFSLDSHTKLSQDTALLAGVFAENGKIKSTVVRPKEITVADVKELENELSKSAKIMHQLERAVYAKFKQNDNYSKILKDTRDAKLVCMNDKAEIVEDDILMRIREKL